MNLLSFNPPSYGMFHLLWFLSTMIVIVISCVFLASKRNEKIDNYFIFIIGCSLLAGETFKQLYLLKQNGFYDWNQFPYQFCSTPMYIAVASFFVKNKKIKDAMYVFLAFFGLVAGSAVMVEPSGVFWYPYTPMVIHSCLWHSSMMIMGIYLIVAKGYGKKFIELFKGFIVYLGLLIIAILFNEIMYPIYFKDNGYNYCNAFYISSHYDANLPVFRDIKPVVPYPVFILLYFLAFCIGVSIVWAITKLIRVLINKYKQKRALI